MTQISNTELEYNESDAVVLDYFLGGSRESKEQWAQRVWSLCQEYKTTAGRGSDGKGMSSCYARDPKDLWEEKKIRRRIVLMKKLLDRHPNDDEKAFLDNIIVNISDSKTITWSNSHSDVETLKLKDDPKYQTANERYAES